MKKTKSHEIMMNREGLKESSLGGADGGGSSIEHLPKKTEWLETPGRGQKFSDKLEKRKRVAPASLCSSHHHSH